MRMKTSQGYCSSVRHEAPAGSQKREVAGGADIAFYVGVPLEAGIFKEDGDGDGSALTTKFSANLNVLDRSGPGRP